MSWDLVAAPWSPALVARGPIGSLPVASTAGRLYFASDTGMVLRDNGASWDDVTPHPAPAPLTVVHMTDDLTLTQANVFVQCTDAARVAGKTLTLPHAADWPGSVVHTMCPSGNSPNVVAQAPDTLVGATCTVQVLSDGTDWYGIDC